MPEEITLDKVQAAWRQLATAIDLFFQSGDVVSIHTLATAAAELLHDVAEHRGSPVTVPSFDSLILAFVKPERQHDVRRLLRRPQNFFKHADKDATETLVFNPEAAEWRLLDACLAYDAVTNTMPILTRAFQAWWMMTHPDIVAGPLREVYRKAGEAFEHSDRKTFRASFVTAVAQVEKAGEGGVLNNPASESSTGL